MKGLVIYRWPDGSFVTCEEHSPDRLYYFKIWDRGDEETSIELNLDGGACGTDEFVEHGLAQKIFGFLVDFGIVGSFSDDLGIRSVPFDIMKMPIYVPDEVWERRYDEAKALYQEGVSTTAEPGPFLLWQAVCDEIREEEDLEDRYWDDDEDDEDDGYEYDDWSREDRDEVVLTVTGEDGTEVVEKGISVKDAVDNFTQAELVLPESRREAWEQENASRGTWVAPSVEEVELYRVVGEALPFSWPADRLGEWLRERVS